MRILLLILVLIPLEGRAEGSIFGSDILLAAKEKQHYEVVLRSQERREAELTFAEKIAVARSAWALGLTDLARGLWQEILADREFQGPERDRIILSHAILELQEGRYVEARRIAERGSARLEPSDLRAQFFLVIAETLREQEVLSKAEVYYKRAQEDAQGEVRSEASFLLGKCQIALGLLGQARKSLVSVESHSQYAPMALVHLVEVDMGQKQYEAALTWIHEGREMFPETFESEWMRFSHISALTELGRVKEAERELGKFKKRYADGSAWYSLARAGLEAAYLRKQIGATDSRR